MIATRVLVVLLLVVALARSQTDGRLQPTQPLSDLHCGKERLLTPSLFGYICVNPRAYLPMEWAHTTGSPALQRMVHSVLHLDSYLYLFRLFELLDTGAPMHGLHPEEWATLKNMTHYVGTTTLLLFALFSVLVGLYACFRLLFNVLVKCARRIPEKHRAMLDGAFSVVLLLLLAYNCYVVHFG